MNVFTRMLDRIFTPQRPFPAGIYPYQSPPEAENPLRMHLRVEPDGTGMLLVNASVVLHLNQTAAEYAYHILQGTSEDEVARLVSKRYRVRQDEARKDFIDLKERINGLIETPDLDPVTFLNFDRHVPYSAQVSAPFRLDCALTYRVPENEPANTAPLDRVLRELSADEWQLILKKAWDAGIPHIVFTGGEPTLRDDLCDIIAAAEQNGQVTGLITNGLRLSDAEYLGSLLQSGLDHLMMIFDPKNEASWKALETVMPEDLFTTVHLTVSPGLNDLEDVFKRLSEMGVRSLSLSASSPHAKEAVQSAGELAAKYDLALVWDLPVPYSSINPVGLELAEAGEAVQGAGQAWLYVEPDGDVLAGQGIQPVLGNLLTGGWESIWKK